TRGLYFNNVEIPISRNSEAFKLITRIQDEAHRFAIEFHRSLRSKGQVHSVLDDIEGIGPARRRALMKSFDSIDDIKAADVDRLMQVPSMDRKAAENVYSFFREEASSP
ncbi:MAG TPA: excinuclease ABC subunit C, partial [Lachnospiraceae bacterium]|nr:excinuclease ABC subunit C [Lachnospiraceae bacterium]